MIQIEQIKNFFPLQLQKNNVLYKYMIKEYIQLQILEYLSTTVFVKKLVFIGGTNLRLIKGIDRFSEDLDFDCVDVSEEEFLEIGEKVLRFLQNNGWKAEIRNTKKEKLKAYRCNIYFPNLLFDLGLTGHKDERFLIKLESQDQEINYQPKLINIKGCGFFFPFPVPPDNILCSMKISAMLARQKGRDFYDVMFLLAQTKPDYYFLKKKCNISSLEELKSQTELILKSVNLKDKMRDFEHLIFDKSKSRKILLFGEFISSLE